MSDAQKPHKTLYRYDVKTFGGEDFVDAEAHSALMGRYNDLVEQLEAAQHENAVLREFWSAHWGVEQAVADFDLHAEAVERLRAAQEAAYRLVSNPASEPESR